MTGSFMQAYWLHVNRVHVHVQWTASIRVLLAKRVHEFCALWAYPRLLLATVVIDIYIHTSFMMPFVTIITTNHCQILVVVGQLTYTVYAFFNGSVYTSTEVFRTARL